jgi:hypothetical protein
MTISRAQMGSQLTGNRMPVKKVKGGYKFGSSGKVYPTRAGAERQQRAAYANGYRGMAAGGKVPSGYHRMPDGSIMKDSAHKMGHGGKVPTGNDAKDLELCRMGKGGKTKSKVNEAGNYTKPSMRKRLFNKIKAGGKGGKPGQWSARKAQMLAKQYKAAGGGYKD